LLKEEADEKAAAAAEVVDDGILRQIDAEEAAEIEFERTTMPEDAILEPCSEVARRCRGKCAYYFTIKRC
jgi:hypothetical protein